MLSKDQLHQIEEDGYVVVKDVLDPKRDLDPIIDAFTAVLDRLAYDLFRQGKITKLYEDLPFEKRLVKIIEETGDSFSQHFDFSLPKGQIGDASVPMCTDPSIFRLMTNSRLLDCVQDVLGPEVYSNPVQHTRLKPPNAIAPQSQTGTSVLVNATPWHQDVAVLTPDADQTSIWTVWIPLGADATISNGCLLVVPGSHKGPLVPHCPNGNGVLRIPEALVPLDEAIPVELERGSVLIFHRQLVHASLPNLTSTLRSSLDLRYQKAGQPTGRAFFPGFVARSQSRPHDELHSSQEWSERWHEVARQMSKPGYVDPSFDRWKEVDHVACS